MKRILDAQARVFLPERWDTAKAFFNQANRHPKETFVELKGFRGKTVHVTRVVEDFITSTKPLKDVLYDLAYYHDNMPIILKETKKDGEEELVCKVQKGYATLKDVINFLMSQIKQPLLNNLRMGGKPFQFLMQEAWQGGGRQVCKKYNSCFTNNCTTFLKADLLGIYTEDRHRSQSLI